MKKLWKKLLHFIYTENDDIEERIFRAIILIGGAVTIAGTLECFVIGKMNATLLPVFLILLGAMVISLAVVFRYKRYNIASVILFLLIIAMVFPSLFILGGGVDGAASIWFSLGILYTFLMFKGKKLVFFLVVCGVIYGGTYLIGYYHPEFIIPMASRTSKYLDVFFGAMAVGLASGLVAKTQLRIFNKEHKINLEQQAELEKSQESKNAFFANMSHEIRTPINAIIGLNEMILRECESEKILEYARDIKIAGGILLSQVNDVLDLSQMEIDKMKLVPVEYQTVNLFSNMLDMVRLRAEKKGLKLLATIDPELPSGLIGDAKRFQQVILNLLDNAIKYTEEGSIILSASGERVSEDEMLLKVQVSDTGIGIRKEDIDHIYDAYNRFDDNKNSHIIGNGLGLAITKQLIELMDGEITVDSVYTKGSTFTVCIRQKIADESTIGEYNFAEERYDESEHYALTFEAPEARVLIVDDNVMNTKVASSLLSATKVQVDIAHSGEECLRMTKRKYYHVILMDYMMPIRNGLDTMMELRRQENGLCKETPVIALTANSLSSSRQTYIDEGFDGYVEKPIEGKKLEEEVLRMLPKDVVEYVKGGEDGRERIVGIRRLSSRKRKKIYITTDCVCDLPQEMMEQYDIKLMYLYIQTPNGRFADTREIDSDSLDQYLTSDSSTAYPDSVTVEEFEEFFANALEEAEQIIHISMGSRSGMTYSVAVRAAKSFDHVKVIDSEQISCGQGLIVLHAAKLAANGKSMEVICSEVERMIRRVHTAFVMPSANIFHQNGYMRSFVVKICDALQLAPFVVMKQKRPTAVALLGGNIERAWKQGIWLHLRKRRRINKRVVCISHVGCSVKQLQMIKNEVLSRVPFERVIIQKASFSSACSAGTLTVGISYYRK